GLGGHRAGPAVGVEGDGVLVDRPLGVEGQVGGEAVGGAAGVGRAAAIGRGVPAGEVVVGQAEGVGREGGAVAVVADLGIHAAGPAVGVEGHGVLVDRPLGVEGHVGGEAVGGAAGVGRARAVGGGVPAG